MIKSSTFCLQQNRLIELTPKAPFDASSGILYDEGYFFKSKRFLTMALRLKTIYSKFLQPVQRIIKQKTTIYLILILAMETMQTYHKNRTVLKLRVKTKVIQAFSGTN